jgi:rod shape-determining protein MreC
LLQIFAFYLIFLNNSYQRATIVTTSNNLVGQVYEGYSVVNDYLRLGSTNKLLAAENARLRNFD